MRGVLPVVGLALVLFAGVILYLFKQGMDGYMSDRDLANAPMSVPADMQMREYQPTDAIVLAGVSFDPEASGYVNSVLARFDATVSEHSEAIAQVFQSADGAVAVRLQRAEQQEPPEEASSRNALQQLSAIRDERAADPDPIPFGRIAGGTVALHPAPTDAAGNVPPKFRRFVAGFGDPYVGETLSVEVISTANDAAIAAALGAFDWEALNQKLSSPSPDISNAIAFVTADGGPVSDGPPPRNPRFEAYAMMQNPAGLAEHDLTALGLIRDDLLVDVEQFAELEIALNSFSEPVLQIIAIEYPEVILRVAAINMSDGNRQLSVVEAHILSQLASGNATQENLAEYLTPDRDVADAVRALAVQAPE